MDNKQIVDLFWNRSENAIKEVSKKTADIVTILQTEF